MTEATSNPAAEEPQQAPAPRPKKRDVHGWVVLDKPVGMTSTHAVAVVKRAFSAKKAGHAGTLDPLASGLLPIALGEATKTVPFVMDGRKAYEFTVAWGSQTDTDDTEGKVVATSEKRPDEAAIVALLPRFTGTIQQVPPKFSAIKIAGERAYDLARDGEEVTLQARPVEITALRIVQHDGPTTTFEAECGKGTYVRAIARDLGLALGCLGHVAHLRRTRVGPFAVADAATVEALRDGDNATEALLPVSAALALIPEITVHRDAALRLKRGQSVLLRGRDAPLEAEAVYAVSGGVLIATGSIAQGEFVPHRVFNL
ncbi:MULTISPECIES: tRNA pseudouridine(55) synthase TruB [unclassified Bosea (in: a-proteobacteria)]|uniref:tRNA pseudouridine(55) synthase TruB n=1 Tax=unclassified Bosea (in: a-proteobacteria) TaxID=2653178 RepID=UPI000F763B2B|nr:MULTISPECIES: tRNA pseudouridine(55) synthase TruB [unclassified Bosea (in: a-proteobacteria)]AZO79836.1 tRNA pseudouridine(55) synthase TruB [Bosea sp. Tri-49]